jgi:hypothetical protein
MHDSSILQPKCHGIAEIDEPLSGFPRHLVALHPGSLASRQVSIVIIAERKGRQTITVAATGLGLLEVLIISIAFAGLDGDALYKAELAAAASSRVDEPGAYMSLGRVVAEQLLLAELPRGGRTGGHLAVAGDEVAQGGRIFGESDKCFQAVDEVGTASERQRPVAVCVPLALPGVEDSKVKVPAAE